MSEWITPREAAERVNRSVRTVYNWIDAGRLTTQTDGQGITLIEGLSLLNAEAKVKRGRPLGSARPPTTARRLA